MQLPALLALLPVLATVSAAPHLQHAPRSTPTNHLVDVHAKPHHPGRPAQPHRRHSDEGAWYSDSEGSWSQQGSPTEYSEADVDMPTSTPSMTSESSTPSETSMSTIGPTPTPEPTSMSESEVESEMPTSTMSRTTPKTTSTMISMTTSEMMASKTGSEEMPSSTSEAVIDAAANDTSDEVPATSTSASVAEPQETEKGKKIRYKQCPSTGTVSQIKVTPCEGGKGTILDPCHFHAGSNYTIELSYVTPLDSLHPRSNLVARDRSMSNGPGSEDFPYSGQSFDACAYTDCPIPANVTNQYTYEFVTLNDRFDQLTFNITNGFEGPSMFCGYFPVTFVPNVVARSMRLPFAGLGSRGPK